jgi:hypothetical protein
LTNLPGKRWRSASPGGSNDVIDMLSDLFILRGVPAHIGSDILSL